MQPVTPILRLCFSESEEAYFPLERLTGIFLLWWRCSSGI